MKYLIPCFLLLATACSKPSEKITFKLMEPPVGMNTEEPHLFQDGDHLYLSWTEDNGEMARLLNSRFDGEQWGNVEEIASGNDWFVNWADFPSMLVTENYQVAHYLQKSAEATFAYDVMLRIKGTEWSEAIKLNRDTVAGEHGFVELFPVGENFGALWLDGRNMTGSHGEGGGAMNVRFAEISPDGEFLQDLVLDYMTCECCQTAATVSGDVTIVAYRDRSESDIRDIYYTRSVDGQWESPRAIHDDNWKIQGCPVNGPHLSSSGDEVVLAWFTAADLTPAVKVSFSEDQGSVFSDPVRADDGNPIGRVGTASLPGGLHLVTWIEDLGSQAVIRLKAFRKGQEVETADVAPVSTNRASGFPIITVMDNQAFVTWTETGDESRVRMASASIGHLME